VYNDLIMQKLSITVQLPKQRAKHLHEVLAGRRGGRMRSPLDHNRNELKRALRKELVHDNHA